MKEFKTIVHEYKRVDFAQRKAALATVVKVRGSSYRSPGARMLITDDGRWVGSISGGCLEGDALRKARKVMEENKPVTVTYDTREESNQQLGIGLGCNGVIDVLIEPLGPANELNPVRLFENFITSKEPLTMATVFSGKNENSQKLLMNRQAEKVVCTISSASLTALIVPDLVQLFETKKSHSRKYVAEGQEYEIFLELIQPSISVIIYGGGFDARPVSHLAKTLGWDVTVTDECVAHIAPVFFPSADQISLCSRQFADRNFEITPYTACILMSHNYEYDRDVLRKLVKTSTPYIGILGPRKRFEKMYEEYAREGFELSKEDISRIHSPVGLDIGAETPDEIALAIIAEIQGKFSNRSGGFLKYRTGPIHTRDAYGEQVFKQVYLAQEDTGQSRHG